MSEHFIKTGNKSYRKIDRILAVIALGTILIAWFVGFSKTEADLIPFLKQVLPEADRFEPLTGRSYAAWKGQTDEQLIGYGAIGTGSGYGGDMHVAVGVDTEGTVVSLAIVEQKETFSFFRRVLRGNLLKSLLGKTCADRFTLGEDVDVITGATYTSRALVDAVRQASRNVAVKNLGFSVPPEPVSKIKFGFPEAVLIVLFTIGLVRNIRSFKYIKIVRWISMLTGLAVLGFIYNRPFTVVYINKLLLGFWPEWQTHLYWYLLIGGILFFFIIDNKNSYCEWFCPFGAAQECFGIIGGAKVRAPDRFHYTLRWVQRGLAWLVIVLALLFRNPGISSYEVFGTLFKLIGSNYQFALLGIVMLAALFFKRPWCSYLCSLRPVTEFIRLIRNWVKELWQNYHQRQAM